MATFGNGEVYAVFRSGSALIGYYQKKSEDKILVTYKDHYEIGYIYLENEEPRDIWLSRMGILKRKQEQGFKNPFRDDKGSPCMLAAEMYSYPNEQYSFAPIQGENSREWIAKYTGDPIGAAAAFICMCYDVADSGECHDFFRDQ